MNSRIHGRKPPGNVLFVEIESPSSKPDDWVKEGSPSDLISTNPIVEMTCTNRVLSQEQRTVVAVPNRNRPVTDKLSQAVVATSLIRCCDQCYVGVVARQGVAPLDDELLPMIQAPAPSH